MHRVPKRIPDIIDCNFKKDYQILIIYGTNIPDTTGRQTTVEAFTSLDVSICTTWKTEQAKYALKWSKNINKFYLYVSVVPNRPDLNPFAYDVCGVMQQRVYWTLFRNVDELKKRLVEVWSRTLSTLLSMNGESICMPVFAQKGWHFEYLL